MVSFEKGNPSKDQRKEDQVRGAPGPRIGRMRKIFIKNNKGVAENP